MRHSDRLLGPPEPLPLTFTLDGQSYTLPVLDTRTVLDALVLEPPGCWWQLVPMQLTGAHRLHERLFTPEDSLDLDDLEQVAESVLARLLGMDFHAGRRLAVSAYANWMVFDGWSYSCGRDPLSEPIGRLVSACYTWRRSLCQKESELRRLDSDVWAAPPATTASGAPRDPTPSSWSDDAEEASFMAAMSQLGGRG